MKRTGYCGACRESDVGSHAVLTGWVQSSRDMGGVIFLDLRDRTGIMQVVCSRDALTEGEFSLAEGMKNESVIAVSGSIRLRGEETRNPRLATGTIELKADALELLSEAAPLPFPLESADNVREDLRLHYRVLDLRRPKMLQNLRFRHQVEKAVRAYLDSADFLSVETPLLTKSTPEGARDYLVPSRVFPGSFYALPQSPQLFKQLLMAGGIDKYYQVARCFRDEDLRADRQPEFTQVDMELSFVDQEDILTHLEKLFRHLFREVMQIEFAEPFPRLTWTEAMDLYGSDKPDLRFDLPIVELTGLLKDCSFSVFRSVLEQGGVVRAINVPGGGLSLTRTAIEELTKKAQSLGAGGMAWIAVREDGSLNSILTKYFTEEEMQSILTAANTQPGDFLLFCADRLPVVRRVLGGLRLELADRLSLRQPGDFRFLIVTDFPEFEWSDEEGRYMAAHHPFTMPYPEDIPYLKSDPARVRAQAYDVVLNGVELGSGSIRIHDSKLQKLMFEALGFTADQIADRFGFLTEAFRYGTPPHGGFAFGLDRLVMLMLGADSLRDVIAFPKIRDGSCPLTQAPTPVDDSQLTILGISLGKEGEKASASRKQEKAKRIDVDRVAALSKLTFSADEKAQMERELSTILDFASQLSAIDTEGVPPTAHVLPLQNVFREDEPTESLPRTLLLEGAPQTQDGCFCVPKTFDSDASSEKGV